MGAAVIYGLVYGCAYALLGLGVVLIYKGSRVFNFAQAEFGTVAAFVIYLSRTNDVPYPIAILLALIVATAMGLATERFVVQPLFSAPKVTLLVATAGIALLSIGLQLSIGGATLRSYPPIVRGQALRVFGVAVTWQQVFVLVTLAIFAAALAYFFNRTDLGLAVLAASQEPTATNLSGISVRRISALVWGMAALLGGAAGILAPAIQESGFTAGFVTQQYLIFAFVAAVVGGMTSLPGAVLGGVVLGLVEQFTLRYIGTMDWVEVNLPGTPQIAVFLLLVIVLALRPAGLLGKEA